MTHSNVDEHHLPRKLAHAGAAGRIKNIRGIEYRLGLPAASTAGSPSLPRNPNRHHDPQPDRPRRDDYHET